MSHCPNALRLVAVFVAGVTLSSCLCPPRAPRVDRYFHRSTPMSALLGFAYAIDANDWNYAFESLDAQAREAVETPFRLRIAVGFEDDPDTGLSVRETIIRSDRVPCEPKPSATRAMVASRSEGTQGRVHRRCTDDAR